MIKIYTGGTVLDTPADFSMEIEETSPVYNDRGSMSLPATVPATGRNLRALGFPTRIDRARPAERPVAVVHDGARQLRGVANVTEARVGEGITFNVGLDNSAAYEQWRGKTLHEIAGDTTRVWHDSVEAAAEMFEIYRAAPADSPLAVFPLAVARTHMGPDDAGTDYWEVLNSPTAKGLVLPQNVTRVINNEVKRVSIPYGYCITPMLKAWRVFEMCMENLGLSVESNVLREDEELRRLTVLNNCADAICRGRLRYSDLMPDCTVEEFLNALWVRFGLVYMVDYSRGTVRATLLDDILKTPRADELTHMATERESLTIPDPQYLALSAATGLEGAKPATERFEDFTRGMDVSMVRMGLDVSHWRMTGTADDPVWDGDVRDDWYEPDPDQDDDRDDRDDYDYDDDRDDYDYDDDRERAPSRSGAAPTESEAFLAREYVSGLWYHLDSNNGAVRKVSTPFWNWDPQPPGLSAVELTSVDECVPVKRVNVGATGTANPFNNFAPLYLVGARHYHTYIRNSDDEEEDATTPLAFVWAYRLDGRTIGRVTPEDETGHRIMLLDGSRPRVSLLFHLADGLFANYWRRYDEILRHGNITAEVDLRVPAHIFPHLDMLRPVHLHGVRCLIDKINYLLPADKDIDVRATLRTIQTDGNYNIGREQGVPPIASARDW